jgi:hypothetical protein
MDLTLHEAVHYAYIQSPSNFISSNKKLLEEFYLTFFKLYFDTENYDKNAFKIVLDKIFNPSTVYYNTYYELIPNAFRSYSNIKNDKILKERVVNLWKYVYNAIEASEVFENTTIQKYMRATYKIMFNAVDYGSIHGQELYLPDEIISILSTITPNHPNVIKSLKLIVPGKSTMIKNRLKRIIK